MNFFSKNYNRYVGLDIGNYSIKIIELDHSTNPRLVSYGEIYPLKGSQFLENEVENVRPSELAATITKIAEESNIELSNIVVTIPSEYALFFYTKVAYKDKASLEALIRAEAKKRTPIDFSEVLTDWYEIEIKQENNLIASTIKEAHVVIVTVQKNIFDLLNKTIERLGVQSFAIEPESFSILRTLDIPDVSKTIAILDIGHNDSRLIFSKNGTVSGFHHVSLGGRDVFRQIRLKRNIPDGNTEDVEKIIAEDALKKESELENIRSSFALDISAKIKPFITYHNQKHSSPVVCMYIAGEGALFLHSTKEIEDLLSVPTKFISIFSKIETDDDIPPQLRRKISLTFSEAAGAALNTATSNARSRSRRTSHSGNRKKTQRYRKNKIKKSGEKLSITNLVIKTGIVKDTDKANIILIILSVAILFLSIFMVFGTNEKLESDPDFFFPSI
jgi:type IV pilus assembly protein PilM